MPHLRSAGVPVRTHVPALTAEASQLPAPAPHLAGREAQAAKGVPAVASTPASAATAPDDLREAFPGGSGSF